MPLNDIATEQTKATEKTQAEADQLLDYLATHPDATIRYHASDMILHIHSDASYLSVSHARIRLGGLFYCGDTPPPTLTDSMDLSSTQLPSSKMLWRQPQNQRSTLASKMPKVEHQSELLSLNWDPINLRRL
jgi:hypothetical protein